MWNQSQQIRSQMDSMGSGVTTVPPADLFSLLILLAILIEHLWVRRQNCPTAATLLPPIVLLLTAPLLIRNWALTGWPLFPFDLGLFDLNPHLNWDNDRSRLFLTWLTGHGSGQQGLGGILVAPVMVFIKARFGSLRHYDGMVSPVFLLLPFLLWKIPRTMEIKVISLFSLGFLGFWTLTTQQVRFLLPVPWLIVLLVVGLSVHGKSLLTGLVAVAVLASASLGAAETFRLHPTAFWLSWEDILQYQQNRIIGADLYQQANRQLESGDRLYLVNMRNCGYLLDRDWRADFVLE